jgi:hypothetical protein
MLLLFGVILCKQAAKMRYDVLESLLEGNFLSIRYIMIII